MKTAWLCTASAALLIVLAGCSTSGPSKVAVKAQNARKAAPDFTLSDHTGKPVKLSDFRGKVVLLNFWATWCGPCKVEIPWFIEFQQNYKDRDFVVLGVSFDDDGWKSVKPYMDQKKMNYRVVIGNDQVAAAYGGVDSLPTTLVIDRDGRIASTHVGLISKVDYKTEIETLLNTKVGQNDPNVASSLPSHDALVRAN